jgi:rod shape-determining protein MreD
VILARGAFGIALALLFELALGRFFPGATRYVDILMLPLAAYALRTSQRSAMVVGCASGLLQDFWAEPRLFGLNGLVKTILGWALGGFGARFDLNSFAGRFGAGASLHLLDVALQAGVRRLFGEAWGPVSLAVLLARGVVGGLLTAGVLAIVDRGTKRRKSAAPVRRKV